MRYPAMMSVALLLVSGASLAQQADQGRAQAQGQASGMGGMPMQPMHDAGNMPIYGSRMMTPAERAAYRERMRAAKTQQERDRIRAEHHKAMLERARARGMTMPEQPPMQHGGMMQSGQPMQGGGKERQGGG